MNPQDYYLKAKLHEPHEIEHREFGAFVNGKMWRHLKFNNISELRSFLVNQTPDHVYFSASRYSQPSNKDMQEKKAGWLGADLIFDIDYDHLSNPTMEYAEEMALKLHKVLASVYNLKDLIMVFSGSRGFHIHARDNCVQGLNSYERRQIVDDIKNRGIEIDEPVTTDLSRLIRLPGTIHAKTGKACRILESDGSDV